MRYIAIAAGLTLLSTACAEVKSRRSVEEAIKADTAIIINISRDVQRGDYSSL